MSEPASRLVFRGVRGTTPTPDPGNRNYGGNTCCLEMAVGAGHWLIVDCGTGLRSIEAALPAADGSPRRFDVLLTHYHWDHLFGLPFFGPLYDEHSQFTFHGVGFEGAGLREVLESVMRPPWVPIALRDTPSRKHYVDLNSEPFDVGHVAVRHTRLNHPQGVTAFRFEHGNRSIVFATDNEIGDADSDARLRSLSEGASVLIHDAQYTPDEYEHFRGWGHSHWRHATETARQVGAERLVLFHHDPGRTDTEIDDLVGQAAADFLGTEAAREGDALQL